MTPFFFPLGDKATPNKYGSWIDLDHVLLISTLMISESVLERYGRLGELHQGVELRFHVTFAFKNRAVDFTIHAPGVVRDPISGLWVETNPFAHFAGVNFDTAWRLNAFEANYMVLLDAWKRKDDLNVSLAADPLQRELGDARLESPRAADRGPEDGQGG